MAASLLYTIKNTKIHLDMTPSIMIVSFLFLGISMLVSLVLKSKFTKYSKVPLEKWADRPGNSRKNAQGKWHL